MPAIMHAGDAGAKKRCKKNILTAALALYFKRIQRNSLNYCTFSAQLIFYSCVGNPGKKIYYGNPSRRVNFHLGQDNCYWTILTCL